MSKVICDCCNKPIEVFGKALCLDCYCKTKKQRENEKLKQQLSNAIIPKFKRQEHIYCFAFGEIKEFIVVAYLDNNTTLCEDTTTNILEWCDNNFLVLTKEEAEAKLKESLKDDN